MKKVKYPNLNDYDISACSDSGYGGSRSIVNNMKNYESGSENEKCLNDALDPQTSIYTHNDITGKMCTKYFVNTPGTFSLFKNDVEMEMGNLGSVGYK